MAKILLVEDDNNLREIYEARLQAEGYEIVGASNGEEALVVAKKELPDLVIADVMMPRISGFEMLDILRNTKGLEKVKVVMLTALGQAEDKTRADQLGADRYLVKSQVTLEDIVKAASDLLGGGGGSAAPAASTPPQPSTGQAAAPQPSAGTGGNAPQQPTQAQASQPTQTQPAPQTAPPQQATAAPSAPPPTPIAVATPPPASSPPQPQAQPQPPQPNAATPQTAQTPQDNTTQLNDAVKDLMKGTKTEGSTPSEQPQPKQEPTAAPTNTPTGQTKSQAAPAPDQTNNDSVTLNGKKTIKPLGPNAETRPHINDLLAKEEANSDNEPGQAPAGATQSQPQIPTGPHPGGHVFSPTAQPPQQNPPENPNDPNKIAL